MQRSENRTEREAAQVWPGEALQPHNDAAYVTLSYGSGIPSADVTRATCVCLNVCVCVCEHRRCKLDSGSFSGFVTGGCGGGGGVLVKATGEKATVEEAMELIVWVMDKTNCGGMQKLQRAKGVEVEGKNTEHLQCLQSIAKSGGGKIIWCISH